MLQHGGTLLSRLTQNRLLDQLIMGIGDYIDATMKILAPSSGRQTPTTYSKK
jgi:hypothetical protein